MIEAVTFDATGTLFHCPRLGEIYAEVLCRHGLDVEPAEVMRLIREVWQELSCVTVLGRDRFSSHPDGSRGWWRRFLARLAERLEAPTPSPFAAAELFERFARPDAWEVYPEVPAALAALAGEGLTLAVVSNWDDRLPRLLAGLGLAPRFSAVVYSAGIGIEKPDPRIFAAALSRLGVAPAAAVHVGDSGKEDVEGAIAAGMHALLLDRHGVGGDLRDLAELPSRLTAVAGRV
jgi:putative hydrolase of the HAD superfamily